MVSSRVVTHRLLAVIAVMIGLWFLKWSAPISMPFGAAAFIVAVLWPIKRWCDHILPKPTGTVAAVLAMMTTLVIFFGALWMATENIVVKFSEYESQFDSLYQSVASLAHRYEFSLPEIEGQRVTGMLQAVAGDVYSSAATGGLIFALVVMGFPAVTQVASQISGHLPDHASKFGGAAAQIAKKFQVYVATTTLNCLITGVLSYIFSLTIGLDFAFTWAMLTFLLNYVPTIGSILSVFPPTLFALVQYEGWLMPAAVFGGFSAIQLAMGVFVFPKLSGERQALLPVFVLMTMVLWGWLWGIVGALIGVPITAALLIACAQFESTRWIPTLVTIPGNRLVEKTEGRSSQSGDRGQPEAE